VPPPPKHLGRHRHAIRGQFSTRFLHDELNRTNSNDRGDVTAYDHVRDGSVDMDIQWPVFVDKDLFEKHSF